MKIDDFERVAGLYHERSMLKAEIECLERRSPIEIIILEARKYCGTMQKQAGVYQDHKMSEAISDAVVVELQRRLVVNADQLAALGVRL